MKKRFLFITAITASLLFALTGCIDSSDTSVLKVAIILAENDFNELELSIPAAEFEHLGYEFDTATRSGANAEGVSGQILSDNLKIGDLDESRYDALLLPGGPGTESLYGNREILGLIRQFHQSGKVIGALGTAPVLLAQTGLLKEKEAACISSRFTELTEAGGIFSGKKVAVTGNLVTAVGGNHQNITQFTETFLSVLHKEDRDFSEYGAPEITYNEDRSTFSFQWNSFTRKGGIFFPTDAENRTDLSICLVLHGAGSSGEVMRNSGFDQLAEQLGFIMVYPDGYNGQWDVIPGNQTVTDDLGFLSSLVLTLAKKYNVGPERIYGTGFSMGGFMTYRMAQDLPGFFSAIAPVGGLMIQRGSLEQIQPLSLLHIHAADDRVINLNGSSGIYPLSNTISLWKQKNGTDQLSFSHDDDQRTITSWKNSETGRVTELILYKYGGHAWFFDLTPTVMDFFYNHPERGSIISLKSPSNERILPPSETIELQAVFEHQNESHTIKSVHFYANQELIGISREFPWSINWVSPAQGLFQITIRAELLTGSNESDRKIISSTDFPQYWISEENIAKNGTIRTSSRESRYLGGEQAVDNLLNTRWSSRPSDHEWFEIDLNSVKEVSGISILWEAAAAQEYSILLSTDGSEWETVLTVTDAPGGSEYYTFPPSKARFIRFQGRRRATVYGYSFWEMMVHGH